MKKKLPLGVSNFKELMTKNYYFIDKSLLIKDLLDDGGKVILFPRPRRFGKTINLTMLRYFFEQTEEDTSKLFHSLKIWHQGETYQREQGHYPVIFLTFKDVKCADWATCLDSIKGLLAEEYERHQPMVFPTLTAAEKVDYQAIVDKTAKLAVYQESLRKLSLYLARQSQKQVVILIDEYDTPIQEGYLHGYYADAIGFMRNFLGGGLKDNVSLAKGVLTGILRVAKESIFSGLNNLRVCTLLDTDYSTYFGLLEHEVEQLLQDYRVGTPIEEVRHWYNGYMFGGNVIYNPWSLIHYTLEWNKKGFRPYWVHTSSNGLIHKILTSSSAVVKKEMETLLRGGSIRKEIEENLQFHDIDHGSRALWSLLLFSGYLKVISQEGERRIFAELQIPNIEVISLFEKIVRDWFEKSVDETLYDEMLYALVNGDIDTFEAIFQDFIKKTFSMFDPVGDEPERVYHAFVLGMLIGLQGKYEVRSNRESGYGRYDVMLIPKKKQQKGVIIEFKKVKQNESIEQVVASALKQIEEKDYATELRSLGCEDILTLAIVFQGKKVRVALGE